MASTMLLAFALRFLVSLRVISAVGSSLYFRKRYVLFHFLNREFFRALFQKLHVFWAFN